jgi:hypothetical protein
MVVIDHEDLHDFCPTLCRVEWAQSFLRRIPVMMTLIQTSAAPANATAATAFSRCGRFERQGKGPEYRKENGEFGPLAGLAADLDPPAMIGDNTVNDGKSEASTLADIFRREEGLEKSGPLFRHPCRG